MRFTLFLHDKLMQSFLAFRGDGHMKPRTLGFSTPFHISTDRYRSCGDGLCTEFGCKAKADCTTAERGSVGTEDGGSSCFDGAMVDQDDLWGRSFKGIHKNPSTGAGAG